MSALEPLDRVPRVNLDAATGADLNPRTMFVLSMIDGTLSLRDIIDLSGLPSGEAATLLTELMDVGALEFDA